MLGAAGRCTHPPPAALPSCPRQHALFQASRPPAEQGNTDNTALIMARHGTRHGVAGFGGSVETSEPLPALFASCWSSPQREPRDLKSLKRSRSSMSHSSLHPLPATSLALSSWRCCMATSEPALRSSLQPLWLATSTSLRSLPSHLVGSKPFQR